MKLLLVVVSFIQIAAFGQSEITLPIVKKGIWFLKTASQEIELSQKVTLVELFDDYGLSIFKEKNLQGLINCKGEVIIPAALQRIQYVSHGFYRVITHEQNSLISLDSLGKNKEVYSSNIYTSINHAWIMSVQNNVEQLQHYRTKTTLAVDSLHKVTFLGNYMVYTVDSVPKQLYDPQGALLINEDFTIEEIDNTNVLRSKTKTISVTGNSIWHLPNNAYNFYFNRDHTYGYTIGKKTILYNSDTRKEIISYECNHIEKEGDNKFLVTNETGVGLISTEKRILIPLIYQSIYSSNDYFTKTECYVVSQKGRIGYLDASYKMILPCKYTRFHQTADFFYTFLYDGEGLFSKKTKTDLLPPNYDNIVVKGNTIKGKIEKILYITKIDDQHKIIESLVLKNVISLKNRVYDQKLNPVKLDKRLLTIGWFTKDTLIVNVKKNNDSTLFRKWGLKNGNDSTVIVPNFNAPTFIPNADFSLLYFKKIKVKIKNSPDQEFHTKSIVLLPSGEKIKKFNVIEIDTLDLLMNKKYTRIGSISENAILKPNGELRKYTYFDQTHEDNLRYCSAKEYEYLSIPTFETIPSSSVLFSNNNFGQLLPLNDVDEGYSTYVKFKKPAWNFIKPNGDSMFVEPFLFAQPFYKSSAIILRNTGWGLVSNDSITIPPIYASVTRMREYQDTVFKVGVGRTEKLYLDNELNDLPLIKGSLLKENGDLLLFEDKANHQIINKHGIVVFASTSKLKLLDFNHFVERIKKSYTVYDESGSFQLTLTQEPEAFLSQDVLSLLVKNKTILLNTKGDTLSKIYFDYTSKSNDYILGISGETSYIFTSEGTFLKKVKKGTVLLDDKLPLWALIKGSKITVFQKLIKVKGFESKDKFTKMTNGNFINLGINPSLLFSNGKQKTFHQKLTSVSIHGDFMVLYEDRTAYYIFDFNGQQYGDSLSKKHLSYLGESIFQFRQDKKTIKINFDLNLVDTTDQEFIGDISNGLIRSLILYPNPTFVNERFELLNDSTVLKNPYLLSINHIIGSGDESTLMTGTGRMKSFNTYHKLAEITSEIYSISKPTLYGICRADHSFIIPPIYEKITFVKNNLIQVLLDGKIGYFTMDGKMLYDLNAE